MVCVNGVYDAQGYFWPVKPPIREVIARIDALSWKFWPHAVPSGKLPGTTTAWPTRAR